MDLHGKSGSVALPLTKLVAATDAALFKAPARRAERTTGVVRRSVADILKSVDLKSSILEKN